MFENIAQYEKRAHLRDIGDNKLVIRISEEGYRFNLSVTSGNDDCDFSYMTRFVKAAIKELEKEILTKAFEIEECEFQNIYNEAKREALEFILPTKSEVPKEF